MKLDKQVLRLLIGDSRLTQKQIETVTSAKRAAIVPALTRMEKANFIVLLRDGQKRLPRLKAFVLLDEAKAALAEVLEAAA